MLKRKYFLNILPFLIAIAAYTYLSYQRHVSNPNDKLLPQPSQILSALQRSLALDDGSVAGSDVEFVVDTIYSVSRLAIALLISGSTSLVLALLMHGSPSIRYFLYVPVVVVAKIPPVALLPILLLWLGVNEASKIALLVFGLVPYLSLNLFVELERNRRQFEEKLHTLKLPAWQQYIYVEIPQVWPAFLHEMQTSLGPAWLFLLIAETFGTNYGLGFRIFLVRRFLAMDMSTQSRNVPFCPK